MSEILPGFIMGFREGLEAFLLIAIILNYISTTNQPELKSRVIQGSMAGIVLSLMLGFLLVMVSASLGGVETLTKAWESAASLVALTLVTFFIIWMIRHGHDLSEQVEGQAKQNFSARGLFIISMVIIAREGTEIAIFAFAGKYSIAVVSLGIFSSLVLTALIFYSMVKINLSLLFNITLAYLILQAGFLLGYTLHEGFSAMKGYGIIAADNIVFTKAFNASGTILSHKDGWIGIPLHVLFGWYSKPEWIQFITQYAYTLVIFAFWYVDLQKRRSAASGE